jgi:hypothetical protein
LSEKILTKAVAQLPFPIMANESRDVVIVLGTEKVKSKLSYNQESQGILLNKRSNPRV